MIEATYIWAWRNPAAFELWRRHRPAFFLLYAIGIRARRRNGFNAQGLQPGQAFVGDIAALGMTEQEYRTAKRILSEGQFATFQATNAGTVATLVNSDIFDARSELPNDPANERVTNGQRTGNERVTTNNKEKKGKKDKKGEASPEVAALCGSARISAEHELQRVEIRIKELKDQAGQDAFGTAFYSDKERAERNQLVARRAELKQRLGWLA